MKDGGGGKLRNAPKIFILQVTGRVQAAAFEKSILDAGGQKVLESYFQIEVVQLLQKTARRIAGQIIQMLPVDLVDSGAVFLPQRLHDGSVMFLPQLPQYGRFASPDRTGIRHIKDVLQPGPAAAVLADEGDSYRPGPDPPPHPLIPQLHTGAGRGIRPLGVDQQLVIEWVFMETRSGVQILLPAGRIPRNGMGGLIS